MRRYTIFLLIMAGLVSCAKSDAVRPDMSCPARGAQYFYDPVLIFGWPDESHPATDGDVAAIVNGPVYGDRLRHSYDSLV